MRYLWVGTSVLAAAGVSKSLNDFVEEREGCSGFPLQDSVAPSVVGSSKDQTSEAGSGESASSTATQTVPQDSASLFFCSRHCLTHLWEASSKMSLRTNLLGLCHYLPGTQQREEEDRLWGTLPG